MSQVFVFDPTVADELSKVRGVGRYLQILRENFANEFSFTAELEKITPGSTFINPFFNFLQAPLVSKKIAQKQVAVIHDLIPLKYPSHFPAGLKGNFNIYLNRLALKNYDIVITDSNSSKKDILNILKLPETKVKVVYPCLPKTFVIASAAKQSKNRQIATASSTPRNDTNSKYCLYVGDATWNKNLVNLAKALKIARLPCVFIGKVFSGDVNSASHPWQKELNQFLKLAQNDDNFVLPGFVPDDQLLKYYQDAAVNILVSRDEGFGFSYLEASNFGIPSLLANIEVLKEIAQDSAVFCDPNDPEDIAKKLTHLFNNEEVRKTVGQEAQERVKFFSPKVFKQEFLKSL